MTWEKHDLPEIRITYPEIVLLRLGIEESRANFLKSTIHFNEVFSRWKVRDAMLKAVQWSTKPKRSLLACCWRPSSCYSLHPVIGDTHQLHQRVAVRITTGEECVSGVLFEKNTIWSQTNKKTKECTRLEKRARTTLSTSPSLLQILAFCSSVMSSASTTASNNWNKFYVRL